MSMHTGTSGDNYSMVSNWLDPYTNQPRIVTGIVIGDSNFYQINQDQLDQPTTM